MRRIAVALVLTGATAWAQSMVSERRVGPLLSAFEDGAAQTLHCSIAPLPPRLNYSFRFQAGYVVTIPMNQFRGAGHRWRLMTRITPDEGGRPVYLMSGFALPEVPETKVELQVGGGYLLGEGGYRVRHVFRDEAGRTCRRDWHVDVHRGRGESKVRVAMAPGTVLDLSLRGSRAATAAVAPDDARSLRLTILLHAAPMFPRRTRLRQNDILTLLASVTALLEHVPATSVRLVAFNLDQQREVYRKDGFALGDLGAVAAAMTGVELGLVDVKELQNRRGHLDTIAGLVNGELSVESPADAVVFLGPMSRYSDKPAADALKKVVGAPQFLFFHLAPTFRGRGALQVPEPALPDSIQSTVSRLGGKTLTIRMPGDLAKAIGRLEQTAGGRGPRLEAVTKKTAPPEGGTAHRERQERY